MFYQVLFRLSTPEYVWAVAQKFGDPERLYYGYLSIVPKIVPLATEIAVSMCFAAILPYTAAYFLDRWRQHKTKRNIEKIH